MLTDKQNLIKMLTGQAISFGSRNLEIYENGYTIEFIFSELGSFLRLNVSKELE